MQCDAMLIAQLKQYWCLLTMQAKTATQHKRNTKHIRTTDYCTTFAIPPPVPNMRCLWRSNTASRATMFASCLKFDRTEERTFLVRRSLARFRVLKTPTGRLSKTHRAPCCRNSEIKRAMACMPPLNSKDHKTLVL